MVLDKDVAVPMRDGALLRANVFRPDEGGRFPVLMTLGPYGKDVHLSQLMPEAWEALQRRHPEILKASSCKYLVFETPDPEMWAPEGYVVVKVDSRGAGKSPGRLDVNSPAEFRDFHDRAPSRLRRRRKSTAKRTNDRQMVRRGGVSNSCTVHLRQLRSPRASRARVHEP